MKTPFGIYVHIPFCLRKCLYCDFLSGSYEADIIKEYMDALLREISCAGRNGGFSGEMCADRAVEIDTVFIGGGTPSAIDAGYIVRILDTLRETARVREDAEISIEANPNSLTAEGLSFYRRAGVNRLSIGVQSFVDSELETLGRLHKAEEAKKAYYLAREAGFDNVNLDLITQLPGQSMDSLRFSLKTVADLAPEHVSVYSLIIEEGTPFAKMYGNAVLHSEDESLEMDALVRSFLSEAGYHRYEISNFAKPGFECRHNLKYWGRLPYRGFGLGAASMLVSGKSGRCGEYRFGAELGMEDYLRDHAKPLTERMEAGERLRRLTEREAMEEFMFLGFRRISGIDEREFEGRFGRGFPDEYKEALRKMEGAGFLERNGTVYRLTERGLDVSNILLAEFVEAS